MQSVYLTTMLLSELEKTSGIIVGVSSMAGQSFSLCVSDWCDSRILWHTVMCVCASCCRTPWLS